MQDLLLNKNFNSYRSSRKEVFMHRQRKKYDWDNMTRSEAIETAKILQEKSEAKEDQIISLTRELGSKIDTNNKLNNIMKTLSEDNKYYRQKELLNRQDIASEDPDGTPIIDW